MKQWMVYNKKADFKAVATKYSIDQVTARILRNREINSDSQIEEYLNGTLEEMHSPLFLPDAIRCMNQLDRSITDRRKIRIVGDYDVDGVCATYILYRGLKRAGADADYVIPDRIRDGYGINRNIIEEAARDQVYTIITCDNGISAIEELKAARELGLNVLVTDHHDVRQRTEEDCGCESRDILPPASAVVDPKRESSRYPFPEICGAVVAWKMVQLLYQKRNIPAAEAMDMLEFAAIATVCDVVRLQDENRLIVKYGLRKLSETENPGLRALMEVTGLTEQAHLTTYHVGFVLGPCINAGGRLESAVTALKLFLAEDHADAFQRAVKLKELNDARKDMTKSACTEAYEQAEQKYSGDSVLVVYLPGLHESLAGIVAGRLRERYYKPSFVVTDAEETGDGVKMAKGSGRSIEGYPMADRLQEVSDLLTKFGGHPMAAGFSLRAELVDAFRAALNKNSRLTEEELTEKVWIDVPMPVSYPDEALVRDLEKLEPFGQGNEKPLFADRNLLIRSIRVLGRNRNAVKMELEGQGGGRVNAMLFTDGDAFLKEQAGKNRIDIIYYPAINEYNGTSSLQLTISDYRLKA